MGMCFRLDNQVTFFLGYLATLLKTELRVQNTEGVESEE
jgi:hypothetical protein